MSIQLLPPPASPESTARLSLVRFLRSGSFSCTHTRSTILLGAFCIILFFHGLTVGELYRTETLRAILGEEFLRSGDWIVPRLYGEPLLTKPPGMYAAIAAVSYPLGEVTEWSARLPSALAATALVFLIYWYVGRQLGSLGGLITAVIAPCTYMWLDKATAAEIDMLQVFWVSAALLFFFRAIDEHERKTSPDGGHLVTLSPGHPVSFRWWLAALLCVAGGVLTKWTAAAFFYAAAVPFLVWRRQWRLLFCWQHVVSAAIGASLCFAWVGAAIYMAGWDTFSATLWQEAGPRILPQVHDAPWLTQCLQTLVHPLKQLAANLPWSLFILPTLLPSFLRSLDDRTRRLVQAFHCWTWPNMLMWTLLPDHATRHSFPLFPGITGLAAMSWYVFINGGMNVRWERRHAAFALGVLALFGAVAVAALALLACTMSGATISWGKFAAAQMLPRGIWWLVPIVAVSALWSTSAGWRAYKERRWGGMLTALIVSWVMLKIAFVQIYVPDRNDSRQPRAKAEALAQLVPDGATLYLDQLKDEGIMFYYRRPVLRLRSWDKLPIGKEPVYCIMTYYEREQLKKRPTWIIVEERPLQDAQGDPMFFLALRLGEPPVRQANASFEP